MRGRDGRGQALVELALALPLFVLIVAGLFDLGRGVFAYHTLNNAAREGGRQAIVDQTVEHIRARAVQHAVALGVAADDVVVDFRGTDTPHDPGSCEQLGSPFVAGACVALVVVEYDFDPVVPFVTQLVGPITLRGETQFPIESSCIEPPEPTCPLGS